MSPIEKLNIQEYPLRSREYFPEDEHDNLFKPGLFRQMKDFYKAMNNEKNQLVSMQDYINSVDLTHNLYKLVSL